MKLAHKLDDYRDKAETFLHDHGHKLEDVRAGRDAWTVADRAGILRDAYAEGRDVHDAHVQTVLGRIFPNVTFRDERRY